MSTKINDLKSTLYLKINTTEDVFRLRGCFEKCDRDQLLSWTDKDGYDILHHAIMSENIEAVGIIFALGHFKPPHEPKFHSYIHLAANFGSKTIVIMLLQERPRDYSTNKSKFKWVNPPTETPLHSPDGTSMVTPLDVAALSGHASCVRSILDVSSVKTKLEFGSENHLSAACASNSPSALRLLLKERTTSDDLKSAVGAALKLANAECLDVLLRCNPSLTSLFSGMNLYHVLYSYSLSFKKEWYESLLTVTSVLLKYKQNPVSDIPFRTYPLYSLLSHTPASDFGKSYPYIAACMVVLLNAGVDPNFDEVKFEKEHEALHIQTAFGRLSYSSALHCLYDNVITLVRHFEDDVTNIRRFVTKCTETLLRHGADLSVQGSVGDGPNGFIGNPLHAFLKVSILLGLDERSITTFRLLIQNGSDPNENESGKFPLNTFCDEILMHSEKFEKITKSDEASQLEYVNEIVNTLFGNMTLTSVSSACKIEFGGKPTNDIQRKLFKICKDEMQKRASSVWNLKVLCRLSILQACKWKSTAVVELPIPIALKKYINNVE
ncbi:uncharacterized protein LOC132724177 [Ruditapes philippinarum]|uniref:uncharacterized protein LOC132724177 n=1 Tax=Ruditapes philippinarum TaxID=129788 RepID=UPI00295C0E2C|nr:uncharacterized protein LOC132724177 [Ruditapes philippinarum]